jgi:hypothetical protein
VIVDSTLPCALRCDFIRLEFVCVPPSFRMDHYRSRTQSDDRSFDRRQPVTSASGPLSSESPASLAPTPDAMTDVADACRLCGTGLTWLRASGSDVVSSAPAGASSSSSGAAGTATDAGCCQGWFSDSAFDTLGSEPADRAARSLKQAWPVLMTACGHQQEGQSPPGVTVDGFDVPTLDVNAPALGTTLVMDVPSPPTHLQPGSNVLRFEHPAIEAGLYHLESVNVLVGSLRLVDPYPDVTFPDASVGGGAGASGKPAPTAPPVAASASLSAQASALFKSSRVVSGIDALPRTLRVLPRAAAWNLWVRMPRSVFLGYVGDFSLILAIYCFLHS